jgi:superfamily I DNA/RNA helicase
MTLFRRAGKISPLQARMIDVVVDRVNATPDGAAFWVQGAAGTGKTIVLCHIARQLEATQRNLRIMFLTYTHALKGMIQQAVKESGSDAAVLTYMRFLHSSSDYYDVILLDEVQDVARSDLAVLRGRCKHLVVAGDCEQSIYEVGATEEVIVETITCEKRRLLELFRITKFIVKAAKSILPNTILAEGDVQKVREASASVKRFSNSREEARWAFEEAIAMARPNDPAVILLPHHGAILDFCQELATDMDIASSGPKIPVKHGKIEDYTALNKHFDFHNVAARYFGNGIGNLSDAAGRPLVFIMTYHSSKGLDFDVVHMPFLNSDTQIVRFTPKVDKQDLERTLFFVALTRSRERLVMSYSGRNPHPLVDCLPRDTVAFSDYQKPEVEEEEDLF